ncbi:MAG: hypothetical protein RMK29_15375 [Myxococcales bacterium]|nr:hypothetical protein [Myxococcota bacterium]MDW8283097.1 hypothetical protein [Myxococcales bacterium]
MRLPAAMQRIVEGHGPQADPVGSQPFIAQWGDPTLTPSLHDLLDGAHVG